MLITDKNTLKKFGTNHRFWQGIPGLEKTKGGRLFACFYSGNRCEDRDNCCMLVKSDDDGKTWSEPIAAAYRSKLFRCYDPCLWIDPLGRLWFIWALAPIAPYMPPSAMSQTQKSLYFRRKGSSDTMCA